MSLLILTAISCREKVLFKEIITESANSNDQQADIFTKPLKKPRNEYVCNKLGTYDLYASI